MKTSSYLEIALLSTLATACGFEELGPATTGSETEQHDEGQDDTEQTSGEQEETYSLQFSAQYCASVSSNLRSIDLSYDYSGEATSASGPDETTFMDSTEFKEHQLHSTGCTYVENWTVQDLAAGSWRVVIGTTGMSVSPAECSVEVGVDDTVIVTLGAQESECYGA